MVSAGSLRGAVRLNGGLVRSDTGVTPEVRVLGADSAVAAGWTARSLIPGLSCPTSFLFSKCLGLFRWGCNGRSLKLSTRLHIVQRFRMSGDIPSLPLRTLMQWTGTTYKLKIKMMKRMIVMIQTWIFDILVMASRGCLETRWGRTLTISP